MARTLSVFTILTCAFILAGCSSADENFSKGTPQLVATPDSVSAMLADAADRASTALETLAAVEYSRTPDSGIAPVSGAPAELRRAVTINWTGPVETVAQTLADRASYNFLVIGNPPPVPIIVSIDAQNKQIIDVLRDLGLQMGVRADVKVSSDRRVVELHYPPVTGIGGY